MLRKYVRELIDEFDKLLTTFSIIGLAIGAFVDIRFLEKFAVSPLVLFLALQWANYKLWGKYQTTGLIANCPRFEPSFSVFSGHIATSGSLKLEVEITNRSDINIDIRSVDLPRYLGLEPLMTIVNTPQISRSDNPGKTLFFPFGLDPSKRCTLVLSYKFTSLEKTPLEQAKIIGKLSNDIPVTLDVRYRDGGDDKVLQIHTVINTRGIKHNRRDYYNQHTLLHEFLAISHP